MTDNNLQSSQPETDQETISSEDAQHNFENKLEHLSPITPITYALMAVNLMLFVVVALFGSQWFNINPQVLISFGGNYSPFTTEGEWWRMLTAIFLHGGVIHLAFNMFALYSFGESPLVS